MTRDPTRIPRILDLLGAFWRANPDLRLGQIVDSVAGNGDVFYVEDDLVEAWLRERVPVVRRNCWTCANNQPPLNDCHMIGRLEVAMWVGNTRGWGTDGMPPQDADGCPGWKAKA